MATEHFYMAFGAIIALGGFGLAVYARGGDGGATIKIFGVEISLAAAGGILVIFLGCFVFSLPLIMTLRQETDKPSSIRQGPNQTDSMSQIKKSVAENKEDPKSLNFVEARTKKPTDRGVDGWLDSSPTYNVKLNTFNIPMKANWKACGSELMNHVTEKGFVIDWMEDASFVFGDADQVTRVDCWSDVIIISRAHRPTQEQITRFIAFVDEIEKLAESAEAAVSRKK